MRKVNTFVQWITVILKLMVRCFNPMFRGIHFAQIRNTIHQKRNHTHRQEGDSYVEHHFTIMHTNVRWRGGAKRQSLRRFFHRNGPLDSQCRWCLRFPQVWRTWIDCCTGDLTSRQKVTRFSGTFTRHEAVLSVSWIVTSVSTVHPRVSRWTFITISACLV